MPRTGVWTGLVAGLVSAGLAVLLTACGGWDAPGRDEVPLRAEAGDAPASTPSPSSGQSGSGQPGGEAPVGDTPRAGDFVLTSFPEIADFGEQTSTAADFTDFPEADFASCLDVPVDQIQDHSMEIAYGPLLYDELSEFSLTSTASIVSADTLANDRMIVQLPAYPQCFAEAFADLLLEDALASQGEGSGLSVDIGSAEFAPTPPGATVRISTVISMTWPDGTTMDVYYDVITVLKGRVEASVHVNGAEPFPEDLVAAAVAQVVDKVDNQ